MVKHGTRCSLGWWGKEVDSSKNWKRKKEGLRVFRVSNTSPSRKLHKSVDHFVARSPRYTRGGGLKLSMELASNM